MNRPQQLSKLSSEAYDLLVIGGGITGAGIALDAASRGLKTALVEKNDFAFGTSSRSTKLIHGGLRYLKQLEFGLVKEVGSERAVVHKLAPHLVVPEKMLLPLSGKRGLGYWLTSFGLKLYDVLAGVERKDQRRMLGRLQTLDAEPLLRKEDIKGGALYAEYRTDDARLTLEIMKTSARYRADVLNYVQAIEFFYERNAVAGVRAVDKLSEKTFEIQARVVVNAAGPWVDELRELDHSKKGKHLHLTKGVHIVVPYPALPVKQAIYFDVDDGRMIFAIPRQRVTYIGTTDTTYLGDKDDIATTQADVDYLLQAVNTMFPAVRLSRHHVESSWAGLRPLIFEEKKSVSELSRKDEIFQSPSGLISIAGGKLTGYRKMAERVVDLVVRQAFAKRSLKSCYTAFIPLLQQPFKHYSDVKEYELKLAKQLRSFKLPPTTVQYLVHNYGTQASRIIDSFLSHHSGTDVERSLLEAEVDFTIQHEMTCTLADFFIRRTGLLYFNINHVKKYKEHVAGFMGKRLGWTDERIKKEMKTFMTFYRTATEFK